MLKDIVQFNSTTGDLDVAQTEAPRAGNILATQLASLEFAASMGIDLKYFLESEFRIQTETFKSYCVQRLLESRVNVVNVIDTVETLFSQLTFSVGSSENNGSMIA